MKKPVVKSLGVAAIAVGAGILLALAPAVAASAHVSASATSTVAGSSTVVTFSVPHGCEGSPTTQVRIDIPESVASVSPTVNANWTVEKVTVPLDEPLEGGHGEQITERVGSVVYTAINAGLPDGYRDTFELSLRLPDGAAGDIVEFPTFQVCAEGTAEWVGDDVPSITLTTAEAVDAAPEASADGGDVLARTFGVAGLAVGAVGIVLALTARRKSGA